MMAGPVAEMFGLVSRLPIAGSGSLLEPVPPGEVIEGTAFFPGGTGLWGAPDNERFPVGGVMVLGNTFDTPAKFAAARKRGFEIDVHAGEPFGRASATWRNLIRLLGQAEVDLAYCWFTNAYPALLSSTTAMGDPRVGTDSDLFQACQQVFARSVALLQPHLILALGIQPIRFIGHHARGTSWAKGNFRAIDHAGESLIDLAVGGHHATAMAMLHPCLRQANLRYRRPYLGGAFDPETEILRQYNFRYTQAIATAASHP